MCAKHVTTLSFGRPAQSVAVLACPLSPVAGLLREPHLVPVQPIRQVASSQGDAVHFGQIGMEGFSVKKRAIGRPDTLRASFEQGHAGCVLQGRQFAMDYRAFQMREHSCFPASSMGLSRI
jgi:hypothetical protein